MLTEQHVQIILAHLNDISPDTFDEGSFGPWNFTGLKRDNDQWTLEFSYAEGDDCVGFTYAGDCVDAEGGVSDEWFDQVNDAILEWESSFEE